MKLLTIISAAIALALYLIGLMFKVLHWVGADMLIMVSTAVAVLVFIPSASITIYRDWTKTDS